MSPKARFQTFYFTLIVIVILHIVHVVESEVFIDDTQDWNHCANVGIPCGGRTLATCNQYCVQNGYSYGQCEYSCCFCFKAKDPSTLSGSEHSLKQPWTTQNQESLSPLRTSYKIPLPRNNNKNIIVDESRRGNVCTTSVCVNAAEKLKRNMNENVNPCDNFYEFACGGFLQNTEIPGDASSVTMFTLGEQQVAVQLKQLIEEPVTNDELKPFKLVKGFYQSCMNTAQIEKFGVEPLKTLLRSLGGWPVIEGGQWSSANFDWAKISHAFRKVGLSQDYFISFAVSTDVQNSARRNINLGEPSLGLSKNSLIRGISDPVVSAYYKYQIEMAVLLGADRFEAEREMLQALEFEQTLASIFMPPEERVSQSVFYNPMTISQLQDTYPSLNWMNYIQRLLPDNVKVSQHERVIVQSPKYIQKFLRLISNTPARIQANYVMWRAVAATVTYLNEASRKIHSKFAATITGNVQRQSRSDECIGAVSSVLGNAVGAMYIRRYFKEEAKVSAQEMVDDIGIAFMDILDEATWMDSSTRQKAKEKAWAMHSHIGYPQEHRDDRVLNQFYAKFQVKDRVYMRNVMSIARTATDFSYARLRSPVNKTEWLAHGRNAIVNAFYHPQENSIMFPAAILQGHFFDNDRPRYMNYGAIGWVIGHEITHAFDSQGHQFDKNGDFLDWWDPTTKRTYKLKTECIIKQYGKFLAKDVQLLLNGENSQGENIADNGGIKEAYRGYQSWVNRNGQEKGLPGLSYTPNQLFWITAANNWCNKLRPEYLKHMLETGVHAPGEFRVIGTLSNSVQFAKDFQCPKKTPMNPDHKCSVW